MDGWCGMNGNGVSMERQVWRTGQAEDETRSMALSESETLQRRQTTRGMRLRIKTPEAD